VTETVDTWPGGATYVFRGSIAEDATGGTHVCSATFIPGIGSEMLIQYGRIQVGNTATTQTVLGSITDSLVTVAEVVNPQGIGGTTASLVYTFPQAGDQTVAALVADVDFVGPAANWFVSGLMSFVLQVTTAAVSVTQTFGLVARIKGPALPTVVLLDTVGTSVNTTSTNRVF